MVQSGNGDYRPLVRDFVVKRNREMRWQLGWRCGAKGIFFLSAISRSCLFANESSDEMEREKFKMQGREGITRGGKPLRRLGEMAWIQSSSGGVSHRQKHRHFTICSCFAS